MRRIGDDARIDSPVEAQLHLLLAYANGCRSAGELTGLDPEHLLVPGRAFVGGAMTILSNLEHITPDEYAEWHARISAVLGEPPGGTAQAPSVS